MRIETRRVIAAIAIILFAPISGHATDDETQLRLGLVSFLGEATNYYALDSGLFAKRGLDIKLTRNGAGFQSLQQVMKGKLDIATVAVTPIVYAAMGRYGAGREFSVIASILKSSRLNFVVGAKAKGIHKPIDLNGKRIGITLKTASEYLWSVFTRFHGIDAESVTLINMPVNKMPEAIAAGKIDGAVAWLPFHEMTAAAAPGGGILFRPEQIYSTNWLVIADREFTTRNPDAVVAYLDALKEAESILRDRPEQVAKIHAKYLKFSATELQSLYQFVLFDLELDESLVLNLSQQGLWAAKRGYVPAQAAPDFRQILDPTWLRTVKPHAVSLLD